MDIIEVRSPNYGSRHDTPISMLVLHATVGTARSTINWFGSSASAVSAHYLIAKSGAIYQFVSDRYAAWHAGASAWHGMNSTAIRQASLGIELENANNGKDPYPKAQYLALLGLSRTLIDRYTIHPDMVVRHADIAVPRGRKTDPAGFPWTTYRYDLFERETTDQPVIRGYYVRFDETRVRVSPSTQSAILKKLDGGDHVTGEEVVGENYVHGTLGTSKIWVRLQSGGYIWRKLLESE